jgi:hypothetical protein
VNTGDSQNAKFTKGGVLWFVPARSKDTPREVSIDAVGTKWLTCAGIGRVDKATLRPEEGGGCCYPSRQAWEAEKALLKAWKEFSLEVSCCVIPPVATVEQIEEARKVLGLNYRICLPDE